MSLKPLSVELDQAGHFLDKRIGQDSEYPETNIHGETYDRPANTRKIPATMFGKGYFIVLPHRPLNGDEHDEVEKLLHPDEPIPGKPNNTDSKEWIGSNGEPIAESVSVEQSHPYPEMPGDGQADLSVPGVPHAQDDPAEIETREMGDYPKNSAPLPSPSDYGTSSKRRK